LKEFQPNATLVAFGCFFMLNTISAITAQQKNPNRVNIFVDGSYGFSLSRIVAAWLKVGEILDEKAKQKLLEQDEYEVAFSRAAYYLSYRARTTSELRKKLKDLGFPETVVENVLQRCIELHMLNDAEFAESYVHFRINNRPRSKRLLEMELRAKGLPDNLIQCALSDVHDDSQLAYQTALIYVKRVQTLPYDQFQQKLMGYLNRRGFAYYQCRQTVHTLWDELQTDPKHSLSYMNEGDDV
jgi:regulatory protein